MAKVAFRSVPAVGLYVPAATQNSVAPFPGAPASFVRNSASPQALAQLLPSFAPAPLGVTRTTAASARRHIRERTSAKTPIHRHQGQPARISILSLSFSIRRTRKLSGRTRQTSPFGRLRGKLPEAGGLSKGDFSHPPKESP